MSLLEVHALTKRFSVASPMVVDDLSFDVGHNEIFVLVGPSGCGKTTTLRLIAGFERPEAGEVILDGRRLEGPRQHVRPEHRTVGFVFQDFALFPHLSVMQNVCFGLRVQPRWTRQRRARHVLKMVGLLDMAERAPHELSGGQQQRVALARSIAPAPKLVLLDEPFSNIDAAMRQTMRADVRRLLRRHMVSAVHVTHDQEEALSFADRVGVMREGRIEQIGTPQEVYQRPRTAFVAQFLGLTNLLPGTGCDGGTTAECPLGVVRLLSRAQGQITLSIRPEHLRFEHIYPGQPAGQIIRRQFKGHDLTYTVAYPEHTLMVQADYACPYQVGQTVRVVATEPAVVVENDIG